MIKRDLVLGENEKLYEKEAGYIIYKQDENSCEIRLFEIDTQPKNKGYGKKLIKEFMADKEKEGVIEFYLDSWVTKDGIYSIEVLTSFYQKLGFVETDRMEEEGKLRIFMSRDVIQPSPIPSAVEKDDFATDISPNKT